MNHEKKSQYDEQRIDELWQEIENRDVSRAERIEASRFEASSFETSSFETSSAEGVAESHAMSSTENNDTSLDETNRANIELIVNRLERYTVASPTDEQTEQLIQTIMPIFREQRREQKTHLWSRFISLLMQQMPLFSWMFWVTSTAVIALGALLVPLIKHADINPFLMLIPLVSGFGILYALRSYRTPMGELEATFPVSPVEIVIGRLSIVVLYQIGFALFASLCLFAFDLTDSLFLFIISWLVPLCFSTMLTLVAMLKLGPLAGAGITLVVWGMQMVLGKLLGPFHLLSDIHSPYFSLSRLLGTVLTVALCLYVVRLLLTHDQEVQTDGEHA